MKLLIADDMKSFLDLERSFLSRVDCKLLTATTGLEAIKVAQNETPDLIILDVEMPEMNGIEATRILSAQKDLRHIPIVIVSSTSRKEEALKAGAREFQRKPLDEDRFLEMVQRHAPIRIRKFKRRYVSQPCSFTRDGGSGRGVVVDLSEAGFFLQTSANLVLGDRLQASFQFPVEEVTKGVQAEAMVVRTAPGGFGLRFTDLSEGARLYIREFVGGQPTG